VGITRVVVCLVPDPCEYVCWIEGCVGEDGSLRGSIVRKKSGKTLNLMIISAVLPYPNSICLHHGGRPGGLVRPKLVWGLGPVRR
jgi:hypothetical protein